MAFNGLAGCCGSDGGRSNDSLVFIVGREEAVRPGSLSVRRVQVKGVRLCLRRSGRVIRIEANESATVRKDEKGDTVVPDIPAMVVM